MNLVTQEMFLQCGKSLTTAYMIACRAKGRTHIEHLKTTRSQKSKASSIHKNVYCAYPIHTN